LGILDFLAALIATNLFSSNISFLGPARVKGRIPDEETNKNTAYHEAGHALVAHYTKDAQPIHKVTIIQRGPSLGHVRFGCC
jgi:ATP-dependent Zn protease